MKINCSCDNNCEGATSSCLCGRGEGGDGRGEGVEELNAYVPLLCHEKGDYS